MTGLHKLPPRLAKALLYTIRDRPFDFRRGRWGGGGGAGPFFFFPQDFIPIENQRTFFSQSESQNIFFRAEQKQNIFF